jgi:hypothetical protein
MGLGALRYAGPFFFVLSIPAFFYFVGSAAPLLTVALLLATLIGAEGVAPRGAVPAVAPDASIFRLLPNIYVLVQLAVILWASSVARGLDVGGFAAMSMVTIGPSTHSASLCSPE